MRGFYLFIYLFIYLFNIIFFLFIYLFIYLFSMLCVLDSWKGVLLIFIASPTTKLVDIEICDGVKASYVLFKEGKFTIGK